MCRLSGIARQDFPFRRAGPWIVKGLRGVGTASGPVRKIAVYIAGNYVTDFFVMTNVVTFTRALGDSTRWRIVRLVMDEALSTLR